MRHRNAEVKAIREILNSEDFEDDVAMAKACIEKVYELFQTREWYGLRWGQDAYGPLIDKAEANSLVKAMDGLPTIHALHGVEKFRGYVKAMSPVDKRHCTSCGHPTFAHGYSNHEGCIVRKPSRCECKIRYS